MRNAAPRGRLAEQLRRRSRRPAAQSVAATLVVQALGLVTGIVVARVLGVEGRGEVAVITLWVTLIAYVGDLGLPLAYAFEAARDRDTTPRLAGNALVTIVPHSIAIVLLGYPALLLALHSYRQGLVWEAAAFLAAYVPVSMLARYIAELGRGLGQYGKYNFLRVLILASYGLGLGLFWLAGHLTVGTVLIATVLSNVAALAYAIAAFRRPLAALGRPRFDARLLRSSLVYGLKAHIGNLTPVDAIRVDLLVVAAALDAYHAGLYTVAVSGSMVVRGQGVAIGMIAMPEVARRATLAEQRKVVARYLRFTWALCGAAAAIAVVGADPLIRLVYGRAYAGAAGALRALMVAALVAAVRQVISDVMRGFDRPLHGTVAEIVVWVLLAPGLAVLVPLAGTTGAAGAVAISQAGGMVAAMILARRAGVGIRELLGGLPSKVPASERTAEPALDHAQGSPADAPGPLMAGGDGEMGIPL